MLTASIPAVELVHGARLETLAASDAEALAAAYQRNRAHLAPWVLKQGRRVIVTIQRILAS